MPTLRRRTANRALAGSLIAMLAAAAAACSPAPSTQATDSGTVIQVVAAESVWGALAAQIGGPQVHVTSIVGAAGTGGVDPGTFSPTAADTKAIAGAQVFILNGAGLDPWAGQAAAADPGVGRLEVNIGDEVGVAPGKDPYLWYDPAYVQDAAERIEQDFAQLRPSGAAYFQQQAEAFAKSSAATDVAMAAIIKQQFAGRSVAVCSGMAAQVATGLGLKPVAAAAPQLTDRSIKVLLCQEGAADAADQSLLRAAAGAKAAVVELSEALEPAGTTFQAWLTSQLNEINQALAQA